jgi:hypothetical protein
MEVKMDMGKEAEKEIEQGGGWRKREGKERG